MDDVQGDVHVKVSCKYNMCTQQARCDKVKNQTRIPMTMLCMYLCMSQL